MLRFGIPFLIIIFLYIASQYLFLLYGDEGFIGEIAHAAPLLLLSLLMVSCAFFIIGISKSIIS